MGTSGTAWHKVIKKTNKTSFSYYTPAQECMVENILSLVSTFSERVIMIGEI